jgi:aldose 1-epimerase
LLIDLSLVFQRILLPPTPINLTAAWLTDCLFMTSHTHSSNDQKPVLKSQPWSTARRPNSDIYTLRNRAGMTVRITNYGGVIVSLTAPDKTGAFDEVTLGMDSLAAYVKENPFFGALVGAMATGSPKENLHWTARPIRW